MNVMIDQHIYNKNLEMKPLSGLYLIATPIGNMQDITLRALNLIKDVDFLYSENPKQSSRILHYFNLKRSLYTYNDHSSEASRHKIIELIKENHTVGLISDAGTPTISDPGYKLVKAAQENKLHIYSIPGACAAITALSCSGMPTDNFHFFGFPPRKTQQLYNYLSNLQRYQGSLIFYETANRIVNFFDVAKQLFPGCNSFIGRELTKLHEEKLYGTTNDLHLNLTNHKNLKGELVILIHNQRDEKNVTFENNLDKVLSIGKKYLPLKDLSKLFSEITNLNKNDIYKIGLKCQQPKE